MAVQKSVGRKSAGRKSVSRKSAIRKTTAKKSLGKPAKAPAKKSPRLRRSKALAAERITEILRVLAATYPTAECALRHGSPWELLVATILSAQCTDARVNIVTPQLFKDYPTPGSLAEASLPALEAEVRTTGFFRNKAKSIQGAARLLVTKYAGVLPQTMEELLEFPGAARKTANVVLGVAFKKAVGVVVDTHVYRISRRLELTTSTTPQNVERDLMKIIPQSRWITFSHELIHHGRSLCMARNPKCADCPLETICNSNDKTWSSHESIRLKH